MRAPLKSRSRGCAKTAPDSLIEIGDLASGPAITESRNATSRTVRASGPSTGSVFQASITGCDGTRPGEGRKPTTLQKLAGFLSDPPKSLPSASGTIPQAKATAAPPLLPPQVLVRSYGLSVAPNTSLNVCEPAPNSEVLVLPMMIAPAAFSLSTKRVSSVGMKS